MMRPMIHCGVVGVVLLLPSGCSSHYDEALQEYRSAEPLPFHQRTRDWLSRTDGEKPPAALPGTAEAQATPTFLDRQDEVTAHVLGVPVEWVRGQLAPLREEAELEQTLTDRLEWRELIVAVPLMNPEVHAARERWLAVLHQYSQADYLEGLLRELRGFSRYLDVKTGKPLNKEMQESFFPYPAGITLKGELVREQARLAELEWERVLRDALVETGTWFFDYRFQYESVGTVRENVSLLENLVAVVDDRYRSGAASQADLLKAQTELERQRDLLRDLQSRIRADVARINAQLGRAADAILGDPDSATVPYEAPAVEALTKTALENRQELLARRSQVGRTELAIRLGEVMNRPLFTQGYSTFDRGMMPEASVGEARAPFAAEPDAARPRPAYAQAEAFLSEMKQRLQGEKESLAQELARTQSLARIRLEDAEIAKRKVLLVSVIVLPLSDSAYSIALSAYTSGRMSFLDLLDAERALIKARLEMLEVQRNQDQAVLRLALARGFLESGIDG